LSKRTAAFQTRKGTSLTWARKREKEQKTESPHSVASQERWQFATRGMHQRLKNQEWGRSQVNREAPKRAQERIRKEHRRKGNVAEKELPRRGAKKGVNVSKTFNHKNGHVFARKQKKRVNERNCRSTDVAGED